VTHNVRVKRREQRREARLASVRFQTRCWTVQCAKSLIHISSWFRQGLLGNETILLSSVEQGGLWRDLVITLYSGFAALLIQEAIPKVKSNFVTMLLGAVVQGTPETFLGVNGSVQLIVTIA
jgi:hypothetical protein